MPAGPESCNNLALASNEIKGYNGGGGGGLKNVKIIKMRRLAQRQPGTVFAHQRKTRGCFSFVHHPFIKETLSVFFVFIL